MKTVTIISLMLVVLAGVYFIIRARPDDSVPQAIVDTMETSKPGTLLLVDQSKNQFDNANMAITFKGFGLNKEHSGSIHGIDSHLFFDGTVMSGEVTVNMNTISSDSEKLTAHLKGVDFFDTTTHPTAKFIIHSFDGTTLSGVITIKGISKAISFPLISLSSRKAYAANFTIDMKNFGINQTFANEVIELTVTVPII